MREIKMIEYYCDWSYTKYLKKAGCGIVRKKGKEIEIISRMTTHKSWFRWHEEFAVYQTLLVVERRQEKEVVIFNDDHGLIDGIHYVRTKTKKISNRLFKKIAPILQKTKELEEKGFVIYFESKKDTESLFIKLAHKYSRSYLYEESKLLEQKKEQMIPEYLVLVGIQYEEETQGVPKIELPEQQVIKPIEKNIINTERLLESENIHFEKISHTRWCVFNEKKESIYIHKNVTEIIYAVAKEMLEHRQTLQIQQISKSLVDSLLKNGEVENQYPVIIANIKQWEEENRIQYVS